MDSSPGASQELDVRSIRKPERHPLIFAQFAALGVGESFVLVNSHDPRHLREEFEVEHPDQFGWVYLQSGPEVWRVQITKRSGPLPLLLCETGKLLADQQPDGLAGATWRLATGGRQLDANIIHVPAGAQIAPHAELHLDVLLLVLDGDGELTSGATGLPLRPGALLWLPRGSTRQIAAGLAGLSYLTAHIRRPGLSIQAFPNRPGALAVTGDPSRSNAPGAR